jgi:hypothetical protein
MDFSAPDQAPSDRLNRILWHEARGWDVPYPAARRALFLPMSVTIDDADRREKRP